MSPLVSVCVPAYNHGRFLAEAVRSALGQSEGDIEVVVADNCSTDNTREVMAELCAEDSRLRYERATTHVGMAESFNRCVGLARGRYVKLLCSDDVLEPDGIRVLLDSLEGERAILAGGARRVIDESGRETGLLRFADRAWAGPGNEAARRCFFLGNLIGEPTAVLFRRADFGEGFSTRYTQLVDLDLWFRMLERGQFAYVASPVCRVRIHGAQLTRESAALGRISADKRRLFSDYASRQHMQGTLPQKLLWDFRMAWSAQREPVVERSAESALFYPALWSFMQMGAKLAHRVRGA